MLSVITARVVCRDIMRILRTKALLRDRLLLRRLGMLTHRSRIIGRRMRCSSAALLWLIASGADLGSPTSSATSARYARTDSDPGFRVRAVSNACRACASWPSNQSAFPTPDDWGSLRSNFVTA